MGEAHIVPPSDPAIVVPQRRRLPPAIEVLDPGCDLEELWDRYEVFEALHHALRICNPMSNDQFDELIDVIAPRAATTIHDIGCGYGELLLRSAERAPIAGVGLDPSPWMLATAAERAATRVAGASLRWVLGEARAFRPEPADVAVCIGAEWAWHDFRGTARALAEQTRGGGLVVVGAARLHLDADPTETRRSRGSIDTIDDMRVHLEDVGLHPVHRIDPDDAGWDAYLEGTARCVDQWAASHPGPRSEQWIADQREWQAARDRDRAVIGWSVWVARKQSSPE